MDTNATTNGSADARRYFECRDCLTRTAAHEYRAVCPACGGRLRNIAVPRE